MSTLFTDDTDPKLFNSVLEGLKENKIKTLKSEVKELLQKISKDIEKEEESKLVMRDMFTLLGKYRKVKELRK
jgi:hypothetical protein